MIDPPTHAYRIGWWTHKWWPTRHLLRPAILGRVVLADGSIRARRKPYWQALWRRIRLIRRPHRPWQAEVVTADCSCNARRAFTADGATKRVQALHRRRMAEPPRPGIPVGGKRGVCWAALTPEERVACR
jgi:hypothetical protein